MKKLFFTLLIAGIHFCAHAELPIYQEPELLARANLQDSYNLPNMSFLDNTSPVINNWGEVTFKVAAVEGVNRQGLWLKTRADLLGKIVYNAPDDRFITDPSINDDSKVGFNLFEEGVTDGLFILDGTTLEVEQVLKPTNIPLQYYTYPTIKNNGHIFFRGTSDSNDRGYYEYNGQKLNKLLSEGGDNLGLHSSYLFRPSINESSTIAFKARIGEKGQWDESNPDVILTLQTYLDAKGISYKINPIARDKDSDPSSEFISFGNSLSISNAGSIAFSATLTDGKKALLLFQNNQLKVIAKEGENQISIIEAFAPKINSKGVVAFRAIDQHGLRGIYVADESTQARVVGEGDQIMTDVGLGKILSNPNFPAFGGEIDMNDRGDITFFTTLVNLDNSKELGSAVYKISIKE